MIVLSLLRCRRSLRCHLWLSGNGARAVVLQAATAIPTASRTHPSSRAVSPRLERRVLLERRRRRLGQLRLGDADVGANARQQLLQPCKPDLGPQKAGRGDAHARAVKLHGRVAVQDVHLHRRRLVA